MLKELKEFCLKNWDWRTEKPESHGRIRILKRIAYGFFFFFLVLDKRNGYKWKQERSRIDRKKNFPDTEDCESHNKGIE